MRRIELYNATSTVDDAIEWCRERNLLLREMQCPVCNSSMIESPDKCDDRRIWACRRTQNGRRHQKKVSIRHGSYFASSGLSIRDTLYALYEWSVKTSVEQTCFELQLSNKTVIALFKQFRALATIVVQTRLNGPIGGQGLTVEIDECQIGRR